jgi:glycosyltransferase involved in cell wall biosynthesis
VGYDIVMFDLSKLNVCFVAGTLGQGGAERQLFYILNALKRSGASIRLLCLTQGEFWEERVRELGIAITWVGQNESRLARLRRIISVLRKSRPDIIQSQHFYTNLYAVAAARALGIREIGAIRSDGINEIRSNGRILGYLSLHAPRFIAANSKAAIRNALAMGVPDRRLRLLSNVVDTDRFKPAVLQKKDRIRLISAGRLIPQKRIDRFIDLVAHARNESRADVEGVIVGEGPHKERLIERAAGLGLLNDAVKFVGSVEDMPPVYQQASIFVLTSECEGSPNVVLEAMASGLPVIATKVGGVSDIVRHGDTGFLAEAGDDTSMAESLMRLVKDEDLRVKMGCRARDYVEANHSLYKLPLFLSNTYETVFS